MVRLLAVLSLALCAPAAAASAADWDALADEQNVEVVTQDEDGSARVTTIWLAVLDGNAFIRTSRTTWGANLERDPEVVLRIAGEEHPVRGERLTDQALIDRVHAKFREKYGFADRMSGLVRFLMGGSRIFQVTAR